MKSLIFLVGVVFAVCVQTEFVIAQKRPAQKPSGPVATPSVTPRPIPSTKPTSPAEGFYSEGLKCEAKDYDCQVSNYTKAINVGLATKAVFQKRAAAYAGREEHAKAIADLSKAIELDLNDANSYKDRGKAYLAMPKTATSLQKAIGDFSSAIDLEPKDTDALLKRATLFELLGYMDKASADLDKASLIEPRNLEIQVLRSKMYIANKQPQKAIESLTTALSQNPKNAELFTMRANVYLTIGESDKANSDFDSALRLQPDNLDAQIARIDGLLKVKDFARALQSYDKLIAAKPDSATLFESRGKIYKRQRKWDLAEKDFKKAIELLPANPSAYEALGDVLEKQRKIRESIAFYSSAIELNPKSGHLYLKRGLSYRMAGTFMRTASQAASADFDKAVELLPNNSIAFENRCVFNAMREPESALIDCNRAIELNPNSEEAYYSRSTITYYKDMTVENSQATISARRTANLNAVRNASAELEKDSDNVDALIKRGKANSALEMRDKAIADFNRAIEIDPIAIEAYEERGTTYLYIGDLKNSLKDVARALEMDPNSRAIGLYVWDKKVDVNEITIAISKVLDANPKSVRLHQLRGAIYYSRKNYQKALADLEKARNLFVPSDPFGDYSAYLETAYFLAETHVELKNPKEGLAVYDRAISILPDSGDIYFQRGLFYESSLRNPSQALADYKKAVEIDSSLAFSTILRIKVIDKVEALRLEQQLAISNEKRRKREATANIILGLAQTVVTAVTTPKQTQSSTSSPTSTNQPAGNATSSPSPTANSSSNQNSEDDCPPDTGYSQTTNTGEAEPGTQNQYGWTAWQNHPGYRGLSMRSRPMFQQKGQSYWYFEMEIKSNYQEKVTVTVFTSDKCKMRNNEINELYSDSGGPTLSAGSTGRVTYLRSASSSSVKYWVRMYKESGNGKVAKHDDGSLPLWCQIYPGAQSCPGQP